MREGHIIVRDGVPRFLPQWFRAYLGERYMTMGEHGVYPSWTDKQKEAKVFVGEASARAYIFNLAGARRSGFDTVSVRRVRL